MPAYNRRPTTTSNTLATALRALLEHTSRRVEQGTRSPHTLQMQETHVRWLLAELGAGLRLTAIDHRLIVELGDRSARHLSPRTVAKRLSTLRRALRLAVARGELAAMPAFPEVANPPWVPRVRILRNIAEYRRLLAALPLERAEWVALALWTCQRPGDTERMCWSDVDLRSTPPTMQIRSTKTRRPNPMRVKMPAPLHSVLVARRDRLEAAGTPPVAADPLVVPWPWRSRVLPVVCARIGLPPMTAMDLRHTGISWMVRRKGLTLAAQRWGGWSSFTMMELYYAHALPARLGEASDELASMAEEPSNDNDGGKDDAERDGSGDRGNGS